MSELVQTKVRAEDLKAAEELTTEASSTSDLVTLREILTDQNDGSTEITAEDGTKIEVRTIGNEKFAELGKSATAEAMKNLPVHAEPWQVEEK